MLKKPKPKPEPKPEPKPVMEEAQSLSKQQRKLNNVINSF